MNVPRRGYNKRKGNKGNKGNNPTHGSKECLPGEVVCLSTTGKAVPASKLLAVLKVLCKHVPPVDDDDV